jgi:hypothetical protein
MNIFGIDFSWVTSELLIKSGACALGIIVLIVYFIRKRNKVKVAKIRKEVIKETPIKRQDAQVAHPKFAFWKRKETKAVQQIQEPVNKVPVDIPVEIPVEIPAEMPELIEPVQEYHDTSDLRKCKQCGYIGYGSRFATHDCNSVYNDGEYTGYELRKCKRCGYVGYGERLKNHDCKKTKGW